MTPLPILDNAMLWRQFGAAIDMLHDCVHDCPDELWEAPLWQDQPDQWAAVGFSQFWYLVYHTLFWLDLYLTGTEEGFAPPPPFDLVEMEANETLPRVYARAELLAYGASCRARCKATILGMSSEQAQQMCLFSWGQLPFAELQLYNLRHVQEHGAQLRMFLGQQAGQAARWRVRPDA